MPTMYICACPVTKCLCGARWVQMPVEQKGGRVEIAITETHPAFSDTSRLENFELSADNTEIVAKV